MTPEDAIQWIDNASYEELLDKWRNSPSGDGNSIFFQGKIGEHYSKVMEHKKSLLKPDEAVAISKKIGWK